MKRAMLVMAMAIAVAMGTMSAATTAEEDFGNQQGFADSLSAVAAGPFHLVGNQRIEALADEPSNITITLKKAWFDLDGEQVEGPEDGWEIRLTDDDVTVATLPGDGAYTWTEDQFLGANNIVYSVYEDSADGWEAVNCDDVNTEGLSFSNFNTGPMHGELTGGMGAWNTNMDQTHLVCNQKVEVVPDPDPKPEPEPQRFADVPSDHPFVTEIGWLVDGGITTGFPDDTFRPTQAVTRQAAAAFLYRLAGEPEVAGQAGFADVPVGHPFHDEIAWLVTEGITTGFPDGTFRPTQPVTRQAAAAFLYRYDGQPAATGIAGFSDVPGSHPFHDEIGWLADTGITTGWPDNTFRPTNRVTRQAMAAFLYRFDAAIENRVAFTGLILDEDTGLPISGAPLLCISSEVWTAESDEEGRYACTGLPEGGYVLVLYVDGYQPRSFGPFLYDGAEPVEVDLPLVPMTVHPDVIGTVTDAVSGAVVAGAEIAVFWEDGGERWPSVPSDEEGAYSLRRVDRDREFRLRVAGPWQFEPWIGWEHPDIHVTDVYVYDGGEPLVIDIAITAP